MDGEIEVVLFDFGGVVVPLSGAEGMIEAGSRLGLDTALLHTMLYDGDLWRDVSTGKLTVDQFWKGVSTATGHEAELLQAALRDIWEPPRLDQAVISLVRALRKHVRVAMLSNATTGLEEHLGRLGIADLFDPIINSARVGLRKPDQAVFQHALKILDVPDHAVLFVDDKARNTLVAEEMGIASIVFEGATSLAEQLSRLGLLDLSSTQEHA